LNGRRFASDEVQDAVALEKGAILFRNDEPCICHRLFLIEVINKFTLTFLLYLIRDNIKYVLKK